MANLISQNSISAIYNSTGGKDAVVQVLDVKQVQGQQPQAGERYRCVHCMIMTSELFPPRGCCILEVQD